MTDTTLVANGSARRNSKLAASEAQIAGAQAPAGVRRYLGAFPAYAPTPLVDLPGLSADLGVGAIAVKDEGQRYGLVSFKALGGAYAVARLVHRHVEQKLGRAVDPAELLGEQSKAIAAEMTVCCATDGNHGRSVAAGAQMFGCRCVIFVHSGVTQGRADAIAAFGAEIVRTPGNYDQSVAQATQTSAREGWTTVSDMSWEGYEDIPGLVMQGYTIMLDEIVEQANGPFSHIFVQGGVGGLAAVVAGYFHDLLDAKRPTLIVVEPERANCLQRSASANKRQAMAPGEATVMAMLECYEPSLIAWNILEKAADFFLAIPDGAAIAAIKQLARPLGSDQSLEIGESGGAGLAGLMVALQDVDIASRLGLDAKSRILLIGTEGATDPALYQRLINSPTNDWTAEHHEAAQ